MTNQDKYIEIVDEEGNNIQCELYDIIDYKEQSYALLLEKNNKDINPELVIMKYIEEGEEVYFETIEDEEEFNEVSEYVDSLADEDEDDE